MAEYYYLISSLPMQRLYEEPPMSSADFIMYCGEWVDDKSLTILKSLHLVPEAESSFPQGSVPDEWYRWETFFRNLIVRTRSPEPPRDPENYTLPEKDWYSDAEKGVQEAFSDPNPLDREKSLDNTRWKKLDDLESGHLFDLDKLCVYKIKLMINEKWQGREKENGKKNILRIIDGIYDKDKISM